MNDSRNDSADNMEELPKISPFVSIGCCFTLSVIYVASLYIWSNKNHHDRDHPTTVKKRSLSVLIVMLISPIFVWKFSAPALFERAAFMEILGLRWQGFVQALFIPYLLTVLLFLGPLCVQMQSESMRQFVDPNYWKNCFSNIIWLRNHIVAPLSEEFVFRACMMPLLLQSFSPVTAVFLTPLFFGTAHLHHIIERISMGIDVKTAIIVGCFQMTYTTIFGCYSAFLFARTGHFVATFLVHAFCNHMGLPDIQELWQQHLAKRIILIGCYFLGLIAFIIILPMATQPTLYNNNLYWNV